MHDGIDVAERFRADLPARRLRAVGGQDEDGRAISSPAHLVEHRPAVHDGHLQIEHDRIEFIRLQCFESTFAVIGDGHRVPLGRQDEADHPAHAGIVVDNQDTEGGSLR